MLGKWGFSWEFVWIVSHALQIIKFMFVFSNWCYVSLWCCFNLHFMYEASGRINIAFELRKWYFWDCFLGQMQVNESITRWRLSPLVKGCPSCFLPDRDHHHVITGLHDPSTDDEHYDGWQPSQSRRVTPSWVSPSDDCHGHDDRTITLVLSSPFLWFWPLLSGFVPLIISVL